MREAFPLKTGSLISLDFSQLLSTLPHLTGKPARRRNTPGPGSAFCIDITTPEIKEGAEIILNGLGLNISSAVNLFLKQVINYKGIPFDLRLPNAETRRAVDDIRCGRDLESADTVEEMFQKIGA